MTKARRTKAERDADKIAKRELAGRLDTLLADPAVVKFFKRYQDKLVAEMVGAAPTDDDARRGAALKLQALVLFKADLTAAISEGAAMARQLNKQTEVTRGSSTVN